MSVDEIRSEREQELLLVVERLSTQDRRRIAHLVELLSRAPADVRAASQRNLRRLLSGDHITESDGIEQIDKVLAGIESELSGRDERTRGDVFPRAFRTRAATTG
jgi:hypothetical protein